MSEHASTPKRLRRDEAAQYIRERYGIPCSAGNLAKLASVGGGPPFRYLNDHWPVYDEPDLDAWAQARISAPVRRASDARQPEHAA
jgi:hypothetical protein